MITPEKALAALAERHDLEGADIREIGQAWAEANALLGPADVADGLAAVVTMFLNSLAETPSTFPDEYADTARIVVERAAEIVTARLQQAGRLPT